MTKSRLSMKFVFTFFTFQFMRPITVCSQSRVLRYILTYPRLWIDRDSVHLKRFHMSFFVSTFWRIIWSWSLTSFLVCILCLYDLTNISKTLFRFTQFTFQQFFVTQQFDEFFFLVVLTRSSTGELELGSGLLFVCFCWSTLTLCVCV